MSKEDKPNALFRDAVKDVKRIKNDNIELPPKKTCILKATPTWDDELESPEPVSSAEKLFFAEKTLPKKLLSRLKKGKLSPEESIDLHGMTVAEAKVYLDTFLDECMANESFCVCIVHGKGRKNAHAPALKNMVNTQLRIDPRVLAFATAPASAGGAGAVMVLLPMKPGQGQKKE